jgi:hypothetical protein
MKVGMVGGVIMSLRPIQAKLMRPCLLNKTTNKSAGGTAQVAYLASIIEALGSISSTSKEKKLGGRVEEVT